MTHHFNRNHLVAIAEANYRSRDAFRLPACGQDIDRLDGAGAAEVSDLDLLNRWSVGAVTQVATDITVVALRAIDRAGQRVSIAFIDCHFSLLDFCWPLTPPINHSHPMRACPQAER